MRDNSVVFLARTRQETRNVYKAHDGDVEGVAETYEARCFAASVHIEHTSVNLRLVSHDTHALTIEASETDDDVLSEVALYFEEFTIIHHSTDHFIHVIGHVGVVGDDFVQEVFLAVDGIEAFQTRSALAVVLGEVREQATDEASKLFFGLSTEVCHTTLLGVHAGTTEVFL